jgi:hypothetical protein
MDFSRARAVADAVLYEGYSLYPYRANSTKNQLRFQFGVIEPHGACATEVLAAGDGRVEGQVRFLRLRRRTVRDGSGRPVASLESGGRLLVAWDEGEPCEINFQHRLGGRDEPVEVILRGDVMDERVGEALVTRTRAPLATRITVESTLVHAERTLYRLRIGFENRGNERAPLIAAAIGTHVLLGGVPFVSLIDPPDWARAGAEACRQSGLWPVLAGEPGRDDLVLSAPFILYDHPQIAPESNGDLFDATEIDEILTLRTRTLTDEEKRLARATDPLVAALLDRIDGLSPDALARLHGTFRDPEVGKRVRLKPGARRTDAQDMFLVGRTATVREVKRDIDGRDWLAVTIDDDPAAGLQAGRFHFFTRDEVETIE